MSGQHCEKDVGFKVAEFSQHLQSTSSNQESPNLTPENVELLTQFATFLQKQKHEKHKHLYDHLKHGHCHSAHMREKFANYVQHSGQHFGKHGLYRRFLNSLHGQHSYYGYGKPGNHGFEYGKHEHGHHSGKGIVKHTVYKKVTPGQTIQIQEREFVGNGRNLSPPSRMTINWTELMEQTSNLYKPMGVGERKYYHCGRRVRAREQVNAIIPKPMEAQGPSPAERNEPLQDNLAIMVKNINIENSSEE